jgi:hypothetical protein
MLNSGWRLPNEIRGSETAGIPSPRRLIISLKVADGFLRRSTGMALVEMLGWSGKR